MLHQNYGRKVIIIQLFASFLSIFDKHRLSIDKTGNTGLSKILNRTSNTRNRPLLTNVCLHQKTEQPLTHHNTIKKQKQLI